MRGVTGLLTGAMLFTSVLDVAGGYQTAGIQYANDGWAVTGGDAFGASIKGPNDNKWSQLFDANVLPAGDFGPSMPNNYPTYVDEEQGCQAIAIAPSDSNIVYFVWNAYLYKISNARSKNRTAVRLPGGPWKAFAVSGPNSSRDPQYRMRVDPQNPNVLLWGPYEGKIVYLLDGATPQEMVVPAGTTDVRGGVPDHHVDFDPTSPVVSGVTQRCCISIAGEGIRESNNGPAGPFTLIAGSPTYPRAVKYDAAGNLWALQGNGEAQNVYKRASGGTTFSQLTNMTAYKWQSIAINPQNTNQIVVCQEDGAMAHSIDGGANWLNGGAWTGGLTPQTRLFPSSIGYSAPGGSTTGSPAQVEYHPTNGKCAFAMGLGIYMSDPPTSGFWNWYEDSLGLSMLVTTAIHVPDNGPPVIGTMDQGLFKMADPVRWNLNKRTYCDPLVGYGHVWALDFAPGNRDFIMCTLAWGQNGHSFSSDAGYTWSPISAGHPKRVAQFTASVTNGVMNVTAVASGNVLTSSLCYYGTAPGQAVALAPDQSGMTGNGGTGTYRVTNLNGDVASMTFWCVDLLRGGKIIVISPTHFVWFPSNNRRPVESRDGGRTWTYVTFTGLPTKSHVTYGSGNAAITFTAVADWDGDQGYTVVINAASGTGSVSYNAGTNTVTVTPATTGTSAAAIAAQINAAATVITASAGGTGAGTPAATTATPNQSNTQPTLAYESGFGWSHWNNLHAFATDKVDGTALAQNYGQQVGVAAAYAGLYRMKPGETAFTRVGPTIGNLYVTGSGQLDSVPGQQGDWLYTSGGSSLYRSTDASTATSPTWTAITGFTSVSCFGFHKATQGQTYPAVVVVGTYSGVRGIWRCDDGTYANWVFCGVYPAGKVNGIDRINGGMQNRDVYMAIHNCGAVLGQYSAAFTGS